MKAEDFIEQARDSELHFIDMDCLKEVLTPEQFKFAADSIIDSNGFQPDYSHQLLDSLMERVLELQGYDVSSIRKAQRFYNE